MCKLSDIFNAQELIVLEEFVEQALEEAKATLEAHLKDSPISDDVSEQAEKYLELLDMQGTRLAALGKLRDKLEEV